MQSESFGVPAPGDSGVIVDRRALPIRMLHSDGTAKPLVLEPATSAWVGAFGADVIRFAAGGGVGRHTHPGAHILFCLAGRGFVEYGLTKHHLEPGFCYLIESNIKHAIEATTDLVLLAVGNDHQPAASKKRLRVVDDEA